MKNFLSSLFEKSKVEKLKVFNFRFFLGIGLLLLQFLGFQNCGQSDFRITDLNPSSVLPLDATAEGALITQFQISLAASPPPTTNNTVHSFEMISDENNVIYQCRLNEEIEFKDCGDRQFTVSNLVDRQHHIDIRGVSPGKISNMVTYSWIQDRIPGRLTFNLPPPSIIGVNQVQIQFIAEDDLSGISRIECSLDSAAWSACESPFDLNNLSTGNHRIAIRAIDRAGNRSIEAVRNFVVNPDLPSVRFITAMPAYTTQSSVAISFVSLDGLGAELSGTKCVLDGGGAYDCQSPVTLTVAEGSHTLVLQAVDSLGRQASAEITWAYDVTAPTITMLSGPKNGEYVSRSLGIPFSFSVEDSLSGVSSIRCHVGAAPPEPCSNSWSIQQIPLGNHTFYVSAIDTVGNQTSTSVVFQLTQFPIGIESSSESLGKLASPTGLAKDSAGNIFVLDTKNYRVQKFSPQGIPISSFGSFGTQGDLGTISSISNDITIGQNGQILVYLSIGKIIKYTAEGEQIGQTAKAAEGITLDSQGNLYVLDNDRITKSNSNGDVLLTFGSSGSANGQLQNATKLVVGEQDKIFVLDGGNSRVQVFDSNGTFLSKFPVQGAGLEGPLSLHNLALGADGEIYIAESNRILKFGPNGDFLMASERLNGQIFGIIVANSVVYASVHEEDKIEKFSLSLVSQGSFGAFGYDDARLVNPRAIAAGPSGSVFVGDSDTRGIKWYSSVGEMQYGQQRKVLGSAKHAVGRAATNTSFLHLSPIALAIDDASNVYVSDYSPKIKKANPIDYSVTEFGGLGTGEGKFGGPIYGLAVCANNALYAIDSSNYRIQKFSLNGDFQLKFGSRGQSDGKFENPVSITCDPSGNVYVLDRADSRIQKFSSNGEFLGKFGSSALAENQLRYAEAIAADSAGSIFVLESFGTPRVVKLNSSGAFVKNYILSGLRGQVYKFAIHNSGGLLVPDENRVVFFAP